MTLCTERRSAALTLPPNTDASTSSSSLIVAPGATHARRAAGLGSLLGRPRFYFDRVGSVGAARCEARGLTTGDLTSLRGRGRFFLCCDHYPLRDAPGRNPDARPPLTAPSVPAFAASVSPRCHSLRLAEAVTDGERTEGKREGQAGCTAHE